MHHKEKVERREYMYSSESIYIIGEIDVPSISFYQSLAVVSIEDIARRARILFGGRS